MSISIMTDDERRVFEADRIRIATQADEIRASVNIREKPGTLQMTGIFIGMLPAKPAAAGKKDPPKTLKIMFVDVEELAAAHMADYEYEIDSPNQISLPARNLALMASTKKILEPLKQKNADPAAIEVAERDYANAQKVLAKISIRQGDVLLVSTFDKTNVNTLRQGGIVKLSGVEGDASYGDNGVLYSKLKCGTPLPINLTDSPFVSIARHIDLFQVPVRLCAPDTKYGEMFPLLFNDYFRSESDHKEHRGPVEKRFLTLSTQEKDWKYGKAEDEPKLKIAYTMWQKQDNSVPGYPAGDFMITATCLEGDWQPSEQNKRNTLRKAFGINDANIFAKIMVANPVPALIMCSVNAESTIRENPGRNHNHDGGTLVTWAESATFLLRQYLLNNCARVSFGYVRKVLGIPANCADEFANCARENLSRSTQLNQANLLSKDGHLVFINDKVVNVSAFSGSLYDLKQQGCEWRIMTSSLLDADKRNVLANLSETESEKILNGAADAQFILPGESIVKLIYAVVPMTAEETLQFNETLQSWRTRRADVAARKVEPEPEPEQKPVEPPKRERSPEVQIEPESPVKKIKGKGKK